MPSARFKAIISFEYLSHIPYNGDAKLTANEDQNHIMQAAQELVETSMPGMSTILTSNFKATVEVIDDGNSRIDPSERSRIIPDGFTESIYGSPPKY